MLAIVAIGVASHWIDGDITAVQDIVIPQKSLGNVFIQRIPEVNGLSIFEMIIVDMIESLIPRRQPLRVEFDNLLAEPAPKSGLAVSSHLMTFGPLANLLFAFDLMGFSEVGLELLSAIKHLGALFDLVGTGLKTSPRCHVIMLRVFVALPVILASEDFGARRERTAIRTGMTLAMLSVIPSVLSDRTGGKNFCGRHT